MLTTAQIKKLKEVAGNFLVHMKIADEATTLTELTVKELADRGWFIWFGEGSYRDGYVAKHSGLFNVSHADQDTYMNAYVKSNLSNFELELCSQYSNRNDQIKDAFRAHRAGFYYASIPVLLSLSEGIGRDLTNLGIYAKENKKPVLNNLFTGLTGLESFELSWLSPLYTSTVLTAPGEKLSPQQMVQFNRHWILHGNSDAYGTEPNSLKAISLVYFVHKSISRLNDILAGNI